MGKLFHIIITALICLVIFPAAGSAQTCCSGGVPLSGNIGFLGAGPGTLQLELSYDLNYLATLKNGSESYDDEYRKRITQSLLLKTGYSITRWLAVDALFSLVNQRRTISFNEQSNSVRTLGAGDAVIMVKYIFPGLNAGGVEIQLGAGPKIPLGPSDLTDDRGITLNADLQPGSNSWDLITWGYFSRQLKARPSSVFSARIVGRFNGTNREYLGSQNYRFGNTLQVYLGIGDQLLIGNRIIIPSLSFRYRHAWADKINDLQLDNTGGRWINIIPAVGWHISQSMIFNLVPEIPIYSKVEGIQLAPTFRIQAGLYMSLGTGKKNQLNQYTL